MAAAVLIALIERYCRARARRITAIALIIAAAIYLIGAVIAGSRLDLLVEAVGLVLFAGMAVLGLLTTPLWLAAGWLLHAVWDTVRAGGADAFMPTWYAQACLGFDLILAAAIFWRSVCLARTDS